MGSAGEWTTLSRPCSAEVMSGAVFGRIAGRSAAVHAKE
jgi:hypothetical protein